MQKSEDVVTPTHSELRDLEILTGGEINFSTLILANPFMPFDSLSTSFLHDLGNYIIRDSRSKNFPDVQSFAFWCGNRNLQELAERHFKDIVRFGKGIAFHIAPNNVPVNFAYSLAAGILTGNVNIVRVPSNFYPQIEIIVDSIKSLMNESNHGWMRERLYVVRYGHQKMITDFLSAHCDVRIIWGGDEAIANIRKSPLSAKASDVVFADRYSICVIDADNYQLVANKNRVARDFFNDTYLFDQNACTAPHLVVWLGNEDDANFARKLFWESLEQIVFDEYKMQEIRSINKLVSAYRLASIQNGAIIESSINNLIVRVLLKQLPVGLENDRSDSGFFIEYIATSISEICKIVNRRFQTLSFLGFDEKFWRDFLTENRMLGIDRVVPIGKTLDFSLSWDGYDIVSMLTRQVDIG
jgi:hypothetical protein